MKRITLFMLLMPTLASASIYQGHAVFEVKTEKVDAFQAAVDEIVLPTRSEVGNISYQYRRLPDEPGQASTRFEFKELWVSQDAMMIDHKEKTPHMRRFFAKLGIGTPQSWVQNFTVDGHELGALNCLAVERRVVPGAVDDLGKGTAEVYGNAVKVTVLDPLNQGDYDQEQIYSFNRAQLHMLAFGAKPVISGKISVGYSWADGFHLDRTYSVKCGLSWN